MPVVRIVAAVWDPQLKEFRPRQPKKNAPARVLTLMLDNLLVILANTIAWSVQELIQIVFPVQIICPITE